jgi:hypothetical protein
MIACSKVTHFETFKVYALLNFHIGAEDGEKYLAKTIVLAIFGIILLVILAYSNHQRQTQRQMFAITN